MDDLVPGDVVLLPFPYTDLTAAKERPALVLTTKEFNESGHDVVVAAITSNLAQAPASVLLTKDDLQSGSIPRTSRIRVGKVALLSKDMVRVRVAQVKPELFRLVMREFESLFP